MKTITNRLLHLDIFHLLSISLTTSQLAGSFAHNGWLTCAILLPSKTNGNHAKMFICCTFCFEFVVFLLPSLFGLLDELGDCELSDTNCPLILGSDTELLRELTKEKLCSWAFNIFFTYCTCILMETAYWWVISSTVIY